MSNNEQPVTPAPIEPLALNAEQIAEMRIIPISLRGWREKDAAGKVPRAIRFGGKKFWRVADLRLWVEWGCPDRKEFERRKREAAEP